MEEQIKPKPAKKPTLDDLIGAQATSGYWPESCKSYLLDRFVDCGDAFAFDTLTKVDQVIQSIQQKLSCSREDILATLVALYILAEFFDDKEDEWTLVARKAKMWLKQQGLDKPESLYKNISF